MPNLAQKMETAIEDRFKSWWEEITGAFEARIKELESRIGALESKAVAAVEPAKTPAPFEVTKGPANPSGESHS